MTKDFQLIWYFEKSNTVYYIDELDEFRTMNTIDKTKYRRRELMKGYESEEYSNKESVSIEEFIEENKRCLYLYKNDYLKWEKDLKKYNIDYSKYYDHVSATDMVFKSLTTRKINSLNIEDITAFEFNLIEKCSCGGLQSLKEPIKTQSYGYDFSSFYVQLLMCGLLYVPLCETREYYIKKLPKKLKYGLYKVNIQSENKEFLNIFTYSKDGYYSNFSIETALKYKKKFDVKVELDIDVEYNYFGWAEEDLVNSQEIYGDWYNKLMPIKNELKGNKLIKNLTSSIWGVQAQFNRVFLTDSEINSKNLTIGFIDEESDYIIKGQSFNNKLKEETYELINRTKPYKNNLARLKPFITSLGRQIIADIIMRDYDNFVRCHTDCVVFKIQQDFSDLNIAPIPESKTTGIIDWINVNNYKKYIE